MLLRIACYSSFVFVVLDWWWSLCVLCRYLFLVVINDCVLFVVCCLLLAVCCYVYRCVMFVVCCLWFVVSCVSLCVVRYVLFVAC